MIQIKSNQMVSMIVIVNNRTRTATFKGERQMAALFRTRLMPMIAVGLSLAGPAVAQAAPSDMDHP